MAAPQFSRAPPFAPRRQRAHNFKHAHATPRTAPSPPYSFPTRAVPAGVFATNTALISLSLNNNQLTARAWPRHYCTLPVTPRPTASARTITSTPTPRRVPPPPPPYSLPTRAVPAGVFANNRALIGLYLSNNQLAARAWPRHYCARPVARAPPPAIAGLQARPRHAALRLPPPNALPHPSSARGRVCHQHGAYFSRIGRQPARRACVAAPLFARAPSPVPRRQRAHGYKPRTAPLPPYSLPTRAVPAGVFATNTALTTLYLNNNQLAAREWRRHFARAPPPILSHSKPPNNTMSSRAAP